MKKRISAIVLCLCMVVVLAMPVSAKSDTFTLKGLQGSFSLTKTTSSVTGKTVYPYSRDFPATRKVSVTMKYYLKGSSTIQTRTGSDLADTVPYASTTDTTAIITLNVPSSKYEVKSATSQHSANVYNEVRSGNLSI